ncbi:deoxyguanosinetriphosphate triphosphohydrolase [Parvibium lacunae]|uniref:Deoxyguanosinetriphosphate triphosphohydrolase-like protein n=1 Tax=Parvibium lacunae TaxID=1888893 RepID=A0A368KYW3_9BURK|nr:deoxyguanosinetriphosphate triphosphohydrolase [Parvibium lacunae]RCS56585.1 deoxyguanosinetriphosphate triphosphohydrolase [Parvibium lacunae]
MLLKPYAADPAYTKGRRYVEPPAGARNEFHRDRDRIIHSAAFRRLEYKTQVFINHEGDLFRTRLTHTLEVAQIARTVARHLGLHEDLTEAICLAHDLGHTPFGHAGQDALHQAMQAHGGFEHNLQSLRVVDELEERYAEFDGLNLCYETREGILKHCSREHALQLGALGERFIQRQQPSLEAQLANLADEIAYNTHDIDDGLRAGLIEFEQLMTQPLFARHAKTVQQSYPGLNARRLVYETTRRMINTWVMDLVTHSSELITAAGIATREAVATVPPLISFSPTIQQETRALKHFLFQNLYRHYQVMRVMQHAQRIIQHLFEAFIAEPRLLPTQYQARLEKHGLARTIADYIAGMTDRYATREYQRIFAPFGSSTRQDIIPDGFVL